MRIDSFRITSYNVCYTKLLRTGLGAGAPLRDAALLANVAAGVVVGEVGTAPITAEKLSLALRMRET